MNHNIAHKKLGRMSIYIQPSEKLKQKESSLLKRIFPQYIYSHLIQEANKENIFSISLFHTYSNFKQSRNPHTNSTEIHHHKQNYCIELIDTKERLV